MEHDPANPSDELQPLLDHLQGFIEQDNLVEAMALFNTLRPAFPDDATLAGLGAYICLRLDFDEQAAGLAMEAFNQGSQDPMTALVLGVACRNCGRHAEAAEALTAAHRAMPERVDAACMLLEETAAAHGFAQAREIYGEVFAATPDGAVTACFDQLLQDASKPAAPVMSPLMSIPEWVARTDGTLAFTGEREVFHVENPPIFGAPSADRLDVMVQGYVPYACSLAGATVFAKSSVVVAADGTALNDTITDPQFGQFLALDYDPIIRMRQGSEVVLDTIAHTVREMPAAVMLSGWVSQHFGHWVPEYLCRLAYLEQHPRFAGTPIIVDDDMPPQHLEFLSLLVPNPIVQIARDEAVRCEELIVAGPSIFFPANLIAGHAVPEENQGGLPVSGFSFIRDRVLRNLPPNGPAAKKIYLPRRSSTWRRLLNEDDVAATLTAMGFEIMFPEEMTVEEQVRMYQSAQVVVAPNGSALYNAIFAPKEVKLIVLSQPGLFNWGTYYGMMRDLGYDLTFVCGDDGQDEKHASYSIPVPRLVAAIEELTACS